MTTKISVAALLALALLSRFSPVAIAQKTVVDIPDIKFSDPDKKTFNLNEQLALHFHADVPKSKLRARVFWESKADLIEKAKSAPPRSCVPYPSFVAGPAGENGAVKFSWFFNPSNLKPVKGRDDAFENQVYTIVLEGTDKPEIDDWRMSPRDVEDYFNKGLEIVVVADERLRSGAKNEVAKVMQKDVPQGPSTGAARIVAARNPTENCIVIRTVPAPGSSTAQLVGERCQGRPGS
jgi:hypothetical protein